MSAFGYVPKSEIASKLGVANSAITNYLQGRIPDAATLEKIADFTNCSIHWLITGKGSRRIVDDRDTALLNVEALKDLIRDVVRDEISQQAAEPEEMDATIEPAEMILAPVVARIEPGRRPDDRTVSDEELAEIQRRLEVRKRKTG